MLDPLTALGLAGNVLQIIDFGFLLVTDGNKIYHSASGALEENRAADELARDLDSLAKRLLESQAVWTKARGDVPLESDEVHLRNICERCSEIAVELQTQLQKLKRQDGAKHRRLKSYKAALISVWRKDHVDAIATRLARYQQELDTHIMIGLRKSVQQTEWRNSVQFASLERQTQELTIAVLDEGGKIDSKLNQQGDVLTRIHEQTSQILSALRLDSRHSSLPAPRYDDVKHIEELYTTPLHEAVKADNILKVKQLLRSSNTDINAQDQDGCRPLHFASTSEVARRLLGDSNIEKNVEDNDGRTALHYAVLKRDLGVTKVLLEAGVDKTIEDDRGRTATFYAQDCPAALWMLNYGPETEAQAADCWNHTGLLHMSWLGDVEGTKFFLSQGANVNAQSAWEQAALSEAACHGSTEIAEMLIKAGANVEPGNEWTPLFVAVRDNRAESVRLLLSYGANKEARLNSGITPLAEACYRGYFEIAEILVEAGCNVHIASHLHISPLQDAAAANQHNLVKLLLKRRADKEFKDALGATAVYDAAIGGHVESLKLLLEAGADPNVIAAEGSPLGQASAEDHYECAKLLLEHGADVNAYQKHGSNFTALGEAAYYGCTRIIELLLDHGANIENCCPQGYSALSMAAHNGQNAAISLLADRGAEIDRRGFGNQDPALDNTPLMRAASRGFDSSVGLLLELGADVNAKTLRGATALDYAAVTGRSDVVDVLIHSGADVNAHAKGGSTALMAASEKGYVDVVRQLLEANANTRLRDLRGCTAWIIAVNHNHDRELAHLLKPGPNEHETLNRLQADRPPGEIAAYINEVYH